MLAAWLTVLVSWMLYAPGIVYGQTIDQVFTLQGISNSQTRSSCSQYQNQLNTYWKEAMMTLAVAYEAIEQYYYTIDDSQEADRDRIRQAMLAWFGVPLPVDDNDHSQEQVTDTIRGMIDRIGDEKKCLLIRRRQTFEKLSIICQETDRCHSGRLLSFLRKHLDHHKADH